MRTRGFKIKYVYIILIVLAILFVSYQAYKALYNPVDTVSAVRTSVYDSISAEGFVIRDETPVLTELSGTVVSAVDNGERVAKGSTIANVFSGEEAANNYLELSQLNEKIEYYESFITKQSATSGDLVLMDSNISGYVYNYVSQVESGWLEDIDSAASRMTDGITNRKILTGESIDVQSVLDDLYAQSKALKNSTPVHSEIVADNAGYFISYTDGLEDMIELDNAVNLSVSNVQSMIDAESNTVSGSVGKIVSDFKWCIACIADIDAVYDLNVGDSTGVFIDGTSLGEIRMNIEALNSDNSGSGKVMILLSSDEIDAEICKLRKVKLEIHFNEYTGIKVPTSAIRSTVSVDDADGKVVKCVYTLSAREVKEKKLEILYEGDGFVIASDHTASDGYIRLYDNIITRGKNLYDGKIIN